MARGLGEARAAEQGVSRDERDYWQRGGNWIEAERQRRR
jgi:hypothetical protein